MELPRRPQRTEQIHQEAHAVERDAEDQHDVVDGQIAGDTQQSQHESVKGASQVNALGDRHLGLVLVFILLRPVAEPPRLDDAEQLAHQQEHDDSTPEQERMAAAHAREVHPH